MVFFVLLGTAFAASCSNPGGQNVTRSDGTTYPYFGMPCSSSGNPTSLHPRALFSLGCIGLRSPTPTSSHAHTKRTSPAFPPSLRNATVSTQHQGRDPACGDCYVDVTCTCNQGCCTANPGPAGYTCLPNSYVGTRARPDFSVHQAREQCCAVLCCVEMYLLPIYDILADIHHFQIYDVTLHAPYVMHKATTRLGWCACRE